MKLLENDPHMTFKLLIQERRWESVRECLKSPERLLLCQARYDSNLTCLGTAVCSWAPLDIVKEMIMIDETLPTTCDAYNFTVLHLGCLNGAPLNIVQYLLRNYGHLARELDCDRRSPLHHAVECACCYAFEIDSPSYIEVVKNLCYYAPDMVHAQDVNGHTPIDMVQDVKADTTTESVKFQRLELLYQVLRLTSIYVYKSNQGLWERKQERDNSNVQVRTLI